MPSPASSHRSTNTEVPAIPQIHVMSPPRTTTTKSRRQPRDTGFPEPFDEGRTTTLPHPEADLSPNATISHEEIAVDRTLKRGRLFTRPRHWHAISHGVISPQVEALHSVMSLSTMRTDSFPREQPKLMSASTSSLRLFKDSAESMRSKRADDEDTPPTSPDVSEHRRKKGLLSRLRRKS
ncbi:hypothetical protein G6O67_003684 [Ophiocordyceps sinensis]|uniref:Uncharacterized protein n=2 Tax=Ophiocordyceps sinensis TaxID=72228 RepID=A0A8H4PS70_9HYPO|nr:hypothetical protein OCS_01704 [Ophiocordyceps sinensis CO18]KAF4509515.1 hypothetical protein G6O67_003684 [Ophiocordyceps sinensis]